VRKPHPRLKANGSGSIIFYTKEKKLKGELAPRLRRKANFLERRNNKWGLEDVNKRYKPQVV